ncbi:hypothetical protein [Brachybacterium sacelli]|uniref:Uncharacterized protein n=1 Tax=Brachybacterium sacelli TaxID=173364 RepID=A0ABS4X7H5_9MICO|nr:hypothetical protein [Brachybacterium sacelli]MBP2384425.1 hypothetical protein [Brachybacterium sacelli]
MNPRAYVPSAASGLLDERARILGQQFWTGTLTRSEAAAKILSAAVDSGVAQLMCHRHHGRLAEVWGSDEVTAAVTSMLVRYALGRAEHDGHLDPDRFADGKLSAAGWIGKVIGTMRTTRILREMSVETRELAAPLVLEQAAVVSAEDAVLAGTVPEVDESTRGLPATSATIRLVHASALHQLLGLPPLSPWNLADEQRADLQHELESRPDSLRRVLAGELAGIEGSVRESVGLLWADWNRDDVAALHALTTSERDIPRVLASAALRPLPRPTARSGDLERLRARARDGVPASATTVVSEAFEAFLDCQVEIHTDFDRIRRRLTATETARRDASREALPLLLRRASLQVGVDHLDLLSGLIALFIEPLPVADPAYFTPTSWRFPA